MVLPDRAHKPAGVWRSVVGICDKLGAQFGWTPSERRLNLRDASRDAHDDLISRYLS